MTVAALIQDLLRLIRNHFYTDAPIRDFKRDERALMQAIARYGYECAARGWNFQTQFIYRDISAVLRSMRDKQDQIQYLPIYLEGAVDRHIRMRADELNAEARKIARQIKQALADVRTAPAPVREATAVETLATFYRDLKRRPQRQSKPQAKQPSLL